MFDHVSFLITIRLIEILNFSRLFQASIARSYCILQVKSAEKCNDFLHSLAAHFLFYLVI